MKTLDEVIKAIEWCTEMDQSGCGACPYVDDPENRCYADDALHYLRQLQLFRQTPLMQGIHKAQKEYALYPVEDWGEENLPLTWSELKQMEGKSVWVEGLHHKHWCIIKGIARKDLSDMEYITLAYLNNKNRIVTYDRRKSAYGVTWQAYRKERG